MFFEPTMALTRLLLLGLLATLPAACAQSEAPGTPGGQAATKITGAEGRGGSVTPSPVEIWHEGRLVRTLQWDELSSLPTESFNTGLEDAQTGHPLVEVLRQAGVNNAKSVLLYGRDAKKPLQLAWAEIADPANQVLMGLTHKGTVKVVAGNSALINRDRWVRHLYKIEADPVASVDDRPARKSG
jgi:hypothetical protein